ncbi:NAD(P)-dependent oxidoreductase [Actinoplanes sichuanensis]|uniref:NAD-dependent epimerase/dehydratase family protein n=1 Tax=Actinoplanes sichuanensis TaxID=512349 RepID=A0ABW4AP48_9ACTN|nr:NAD(P)-dependent oxidoreductase [Actinoplanes sichuanensis]BEL08460.1 NAD(P)-dependent oxidoreductase [Actinoplanes sichuanensis]
MRVFLTGANGFIARATATRLREQGHQVYGMDLRADPEAGVVAGDITRGGPWQDVMAGADVVIHTAAVVSNAVGLDGQWLVNVAGTRRVLDAAVRAGAGRFVQLSSIRAFSDRGFPDGVTEDHPVRPDGNPYVDTKIAGEQVVLQAHAEGRIAVTVVRPGDVYGPGSRPWTVLPLQLIKRYQFLLPAMGTGIFSPVYVDDLVEGLIRAATSRAGAGRVFTLTGGVGVPCREFFGHYYRMLGRRGPIVAPTAVAVGVARAAGRLIRLTGAETEVNAVSMRYFARTGTYSIEKAQRLLGYRPSVDLAEGMARTEAWLRASRLLP